METKQYMASDINDIIFEGRKQAYGAYTLRKEYKRNVSIATGLAAAFLLLLLLGPLAYQKLMPEAPVVEEEKVVRSVTELDAPPPMDETKPPPPPPVDIPPPPATIQYVPPTVVEHAVEDPPPTMEEIKQKPTSSTTNDGPIDDYRPPAQQEVILKPDPPKQQVYEYADQMPNLEGYNDYLQSHIRYPQAAIENHVEGMVVLQVTISEKGEVGEIKVLKGQPMGLTEEAIRVVKNMPKWTPGKMNGNPVAVKTVANIRFQLGNK